MKKSEMETMRDKIHEAYGSAEVMLRVLLEASARVPECVLTRDCEGACDIAGDLLGVYMCLKELFTDNA